jgi:DinB superfamily
MSEEVLELLRRAEAARSEVFSRLDRLSDEEAHTRPSEGAWSVAEIVEHLTLSEGFGIAGLWRAAAEAAFGGGSDPLPPELAARSVDEIFSGATRRIVSPEAVVPSSGGTPLGYWVARFRASGVLLAALGEELDRVGMESVIMPHFVAGDLDGRQRMQFFRWHVERHLSQIDRTIEEISAS